MVLNNLTFKGGFIMKDHKELTNNKPVEVATEPKVVYIPLHQHAGSACKALVKAKDEVKVGQKIGDTEASKAAPVHSSVSGVVKGIEKMYSHDGWEVECVVIESDGKNELHESIVPRENIDKLTKEEIVKIVREAGIVGMGGAQFPTHTKLTAPTQPIEHIILNGAECEPYLTSDHRIMLENAEDIVGGLEILLNYFEGSKGYIGIEDNKQDAIDVMAKAISGKSNMQVASLKTKFPQGDSYRMVDSITKKEVPMDGRCMNVNAMVSNVGTTAAIYQAVKNGKPLYERVVTVTGRGVKEPKNLLVKIGTPIRDLIEQCGGFSANSPGKIIAGGPMTGYTQFTLDTPISKGVTGIIVLTEEEAKPEPASPCIKCGKCLEVCPTHLEPLFISAYALKDRFEDAEKLNALSCIECGSCSYICPAKRPLAESIAHSKRQIKAKRRKS